MSRLAKKPIKIPAGVEIKIDGQFLIFKGKEGDLKIKLLEYLKTEIKNDEILFSATALHKQARANLGTIVSLVKNAILGVSQGFAKNLEIEGIGFRASMEGNNLILNVGFSHPVKIISPPKIKISVEKNSIKIFGADKALVGQITAQIKKIKPAEPYLGKGIRYRGEVIRRKAGKKAAGATGIGATT
jgi:large subunit ribosomal protein L6